MSSLHKRVRVKKEEYLTDLRTQRHNKKQRTDDLTNKQTSNFQSNLRRKESSACYVTLSKSNNVTFIASIRTSQFEEFVASPNILSTISRKVTHNFSTSYSYSIDKPQRINTKQTSTPKSSIGLINKQRLLKSNDPIKKLHLMTANKNRCFVEDFMVLEKNTEILLLIPLNYALIGKFKHCIKKLSPIQVQFSACARPIKYVAMVGVIYSNPFLEELKSGMSLMDLKNGFGKNNNGLFVTLHDPSNSTNTYEFVLTW